MKTSLTTMWFAVDVCLRDFTMRMTGLNMLRVCFVCLTFPITNHVNPAFEKWMDRDISVRAWLDSRISEELLPYTVGAYSSHALWMILEKQFVGASSCHFDLGELESTGEEVGLFFSKLSAVVGSTLSPEVTTNSFSTKASYGNFSGTVF
ncbi:uncharacterized protein LOC18772126 [Prunus persica]|uniref:uncharacterized protein LOC18772126 n=1 Tax=Prunus persica TaxID=3760 RepID=UPI0009AB71D2|nr:uncharacterized protein LOC18772126 [Prunus persica]XP_020420784.1 uncharacterized protein LOC18772126 [Prunus persica]